MAQAIAIGARYDFQTLRLTGTRLFVPLPLGLKSRSYGFLPCR